MVLLLPQIINRAMALVDDDEVEELDGQIGVVDHGHGRFAQRLAFGRVLQLRGLVQGLPFQNRVKPLDGADDHLAGIVDVAGGQALDIVEFGEFAVVVVGQIAHELLLGLLAQVPGVHQKEHAPRAGVFQQAVDGGDGGEGLAGARGHLHQGPRLALGEGAFQSFDGLDLHPAQALRGQGRQGLQAGAQRVRLGQPGLQRLWPVEPEDLPGPGPRIANVPEPGDLAVAFVDEGQGIVILEPFEAAGGVAGRLFSHYRQILPLFRPLGLDDAHRLTIHKQYIIGRAGVGGEFAHGHAQAAAEVHLLSVLHRPAGLGQHGVDFLAGFLFGRAHGAIIHNRRAPCHFPRCTTTFMLSSHVVEPGPARLSHASQHECCGTEQKSLPRSIGNTSRPK